MTEEFFTTSEYEDLKKKVADLENEITGFNPRNFAGVRQKELRQATAANLFGDGSDGNVTVASGTTTLTRDTFYDNLTINGGATLATASFRVFVKNILDNKGNINNNGVVGGNGGNGGDGAGGTGGAAGSAGSAGSAVASGSLPAGLIGKAGKAGGAGKNTGPTTGDD